MSKGKKARISESLYARDRPVQNLVTAIYGIRIVDVSRLTLAGKLLISDRNPLVFVHMVASNTARKC